MDARETRGPGRSRVGTSWRLSHPGVPWLLRIVDAEREYSIERYRPEWREQVVALQTHLWDSDPGVSSDHFAWKYEQNLFDSEPLVYLALHDGEVAGARGFWETRWSNGDGSSQLRAAGAGDLVVSPEHRRRGLFRRIMEVAERDLAARGFPCLLNMSASPITYLGSLRQGWHRVGAYRTMRGESRLVALMRRGAHAARSMPVVWRWASAAGPKDADGAFSRFDAAGALDSPDLVPSRDARPAEMATLSNRIRRDTRMRHAVSREFYEWRFRSALSQYRFVFHYGSDADLDGYIALQARRRADSRSLAIVDWTALDDSVRERLLRAAITQARPQSISVWTESHSETTRALLSKAGFRRFDETRGVDGFTPSLLVKPLAVDGGDADIDTEVWLQSANWDLQMLDSDNF